MLYNISQAIFILIEGFIFLFAYSIISERKKFIFQNKIKTVAFIILYIAFTYWATKFIPLGVHTVVISIFSVLVFTFLFWDSILKAILKFSLILVTMSIIEIIPSLLLLAITQRPMQELVNDKTYTIVMSCCVKAAEILVICLLYRKNIKLGWLNSSRREQSKYRQWIISISLCLLFVVVLNAFVSYNKGQIFIYNIFIFTVYIVMIAAFVAALREGTKLEVMKYANEMIKEHLAQIKEFNDVIAKERHEYKNHLNTIYGLCSLNKENMSEKIKNYINSYANNCEELYLRCESGNDFVDAILNVKYNLAKKQGIELVTEFSEKLNMADINENIIATIIANITQNALEALYKVQKANKQVNLRTLLIGQAFYIYISNNGPQIPPNIKNKIFELGYSTNINSNKERGFGLSIVKAHIESAGGAIKVESSEEKTEFIISMPLKQQVVRANTLQVKNCL